jgi:hypothetical protein
MGNPRLIDCDSVRLLYYFMKTRHFDWAFIYAGLLFITGCCSSPGTHLDGAHVYRVGCRITSDSNDLQIFIATGSKAYPMVTIADNDGYPAIKDFYARAVTLRGEDGISVTIRFEAPARGREIEL